MAFLFETIRRLNDQEVTILLVEQNVRQALHLAGLAYVIEKGRVALSGTGHELLDNPSVRKAFLGL